MRVGIFDSGVGGLTVQRAIFDRLPGLDTVYLGDTARVPYGSKSPEVVTQYSLRNARFLVARGIDLLVVACNTASAVALPALREALAIPVLGVVEPGARAAAHASRSGRIGVIGTPSTVASGAYQRAIAAERPGAEVFARACPLFVPLAEEDGSFWDYQLYSYHKAYGTGYVLMALPAALAVALSRISPDQMQLLFREPLGQMMLASAVVLQTIGFFWIRQIIKIEV
jgi:glutamate racemase